MHAGFRDACKRNRLHGLFIRMSEIFLYKRVYLSFNAVASSSSGICKMPSLVLQIKLTCLKSSKNIETCHVTQGEI